ncbi:dihydrodipicolinate synthase family protein [Cnuibacter physcomitrellae]|uniref:Dihydrodipicolinate synthase family protein n=1 Tax=Cnuibacter physcomitrellae TaxID=1619308 RepID=A0A1X9LU64_9MICO|nr:dihydrodipicolinate synthase family protein [Cnuibacter physcomitrellae]ARJ06769.1 dihydrodipicolinate synthase family protein [Cnuibacter physcomitrellae]GGI38782.1 dihydrodipicolinate synthase family protein [Cnuibacter physcomitrellae]
MTTPLAPGVWGVLATPFRGADLDVDRESVAALARHYERIGATGLTVLGVFGEAASLAPRERADVLATVVDATELPVVAGLTSLATRPALEEAALALEVVGDRLAGVMLQVSSARPGQVIEHLTAVHDSLGVGVVLQDYPVASGVSIPGGDLAAIVEACPFVVAVKSEAPPTSVAIAALTARLDVPVFGGLGGQGLLDELQAGAAGAMTGFSAPEGLLACITAWNEHGFAAARAALMPYLPLINLEQQPRIALAVRKELLRRRGLIAEAGARPPAVAFPEALAPAVEAHLAELELEVGLALGLRAAAGVSR